MRSAGASMLSASFGHKRSRGNMLSQALGIAQGYGSVTRRHTATRVFQSSSFSRTNMPRQGEVKVASLHLMQHNQLHKGVGGGD
ncbi:hypothetical protein SAMN04488005_0449 [Yoonia tamlensis]|uniref:Uncharacterized protein n=1 Tax=Yoonia tamlensis TaxID=390270 RepID=A0A1I6FTB4_9RHOB|nr:hypothetical protein SAMN04488005_0449 [Yoonia tamlensis]